MDEIIQSVCRESLQEKYIVKDEVGRGCYGTVRVVQNKRTGEQLACKTVQKSRLRGRTSVVRREVEALGRLKGHPNIVSLKEVYEDSQSVHLLMAYCDAGDLCDEINRRSKFRERIAVDVFCQVATAVAHCHAAGVMHRDLKPENVLLCRLKGGERVKRSSGGGRWNFWTMLAESDEDEEGGEGEGEGEDGGALFKVKLGDFGQAVALKRGEKMEGQCGSLYYLAPEMFLGRRYGMEADIWSLGIILWALLSGRLPFLDNDKDAVQKAVCSGRLDFSSEPWSRISREAKDLIRRMLTLDPSKRLTAEEILAHPWLQKGKTLSRQVYKQVREEEEEEGGKRIERPSKSGGKKSLEEKLLNGEETEGGFVCLPLPCPSRPPPEASISKPHICSPPPCDPPGRLDEGRDSKSVIGGRKFDGIFESSEDCGYDLTGVSGRSRGCPPSLGPVSPNGSDSSDRFLSASSSGSSIDSCSEGVECCEDASVSSSLTSQNILKESGLKNLLDSVVIALRDMGRGGDALKKKKKKWQEDSEKGKVECTSDQEGSS